LRDGELSSSSLEEGGMNADEALWVAVVDWREIVPRD
jgi:hypothetical protein